MSCAECSRIARPSKGRSGSLPSTLAAWPIRRDEPDARADEDASAVALGMRARNDSRARGTLPPEEADRLALDEVRTVRHPTMAARMTARDPWTEPDPQPEDFDADLDDIAPRHVETRPGGPDAKVMVIAAVEDDTADRRQPRRPLLGQRSVVPIYRAFDRRGGTAPTRQLLSWGHRLPR